MSEDLRQLAERLAQELASRDRVVRGSVGSVSAASPPAAKATVKAAPVSHRSNAARPLSTQTPTPSASKPSSRIADYIDHTLLKAEATRGEIDKLCQEARENRFATVCVNPVWVERCATSLGGSGVGIATVIGFPLGANASETKAFEADLAVQRGATELDMVAAIGHIKSGDWHHVHDDIEAVVGAAGGRLVKVIIESAALTPVEIVKASAIAMEAGAQYVKTSTGFHSAGGASAEAVALMRLVVGDRLGVKASGGVRDCPTALRMLASGATRIGTSSGVAMSECLGAGPLPLDELLSLADRHESHCATGACVAAVPDPSQGNY